MRTFFFSVAFSLLTGAFATPANTQGAYAPAADVVVPGWSHLATTPQEGFTIYEYRGEGNNTLRHVVRTTPKGTFETWTENERKVGLRRYSGKYDYTIESEQAFSHGSVRGMHLRLVINNHKRNISFAFWVGKNGSWHVLVAYNYKEHRPIASALMEAVKTFSR